MSSHLFRIRPEESYPFYMKEECGGTHVELHLILIHGGDGVVELLVRAVRGLRQVCVPAPSNQCFRYCPGRDRLQTF